ncbi:MAG: CocE/NonD family hydrolase [Bacteroidetes bacterium]|nr:CocE/NonD family hydrolase [Bacteroidota bacterium]
MKYTIATFCLLIFFSLFPLQAQLRHAETDIPVRDGNVLSADIYVNEGSRPKPVILVQTPYNKTTYRLTFGLYRETVFPLDSSKYQYVIVDWRGFYASKDAAVAGYDRGLDGYDIVEWIAAQPWCNGKVATYGGSALGMIQFQTARLHPPHLVCAAPMIIDYRTEYSDYYYGGDLRREHVETLEKLGFITVGLVTSQPVENAYWRLVTSRSDYPADIEVPLLMVSGWFDHYPNDVLRAFHDLRAQSGENVRQQHRLIMGPWLHSSVDLADQGELTFPNAVRIAREAAFAFFDYYLNGAKNGWPLTPVMRYYQMGENEWRSCDDWFALGTDEHTLFFGSGGSLSREPASGGGTADAFSADPRDPSPSHGGARFNPFDPSVIPGPLDIRDVVESRSDVLVYTTETLTEDLVVSGAGTVQLFARSDRPDTDFSVRLCDVYPDGRSIILTDGITRARFREGTDREVFMNPDSVHRIDIALQELAHTFLKGHRVRVVIGGADYPRFDINLNNGSALYAAGDTLTAANQIYHSDVFPSALILETGQTVNASRLPVSPASLRLLEPWPQPLTQGNSLHISFDASPAQNVRIDIRDLLGRHVQTLYEGSGKEKAQLSWDGTNAAGHLVSPGVYVLTLASASEIQTRLLSVVR